MASAAMSSSPAVQRGAAAVNSLEQRTGVSQARIMGTVRVIGGALIALAMITLVLTEIFTLDAMNVSDGPFASVYDTLTTTGPAALTLLVIGLIVLAANRIMGLFGGGGF